MAAKATGRALLKARGHSNHQRPGRVRDQQPSPPQTSQFPIFPRPRAGTCHGGSSGRGDSLPGTSLHRMPEWPVGHVKPTLGEMLCQILGMGQWASHISEDCDTGKSPLAPDSMYLWYGRD